MFKTLSRYFSLKKGTEHSKICLVVEKPFPPSVCVRQVPPPKFLLFSEIQKSDSKNKISSEGNNFVCDYFLHVVGRSILFLRNFLAFSLVGYQHFLLQKRIFSQNAICSEKHFVLNFVRY